MTQIGWLIDCNIPIPTHTCCCQQKPPMCVWEREGKALHEEKSTFKIQCLLQ
jgi:hypothetical protein